MRTRVLVLVVVAVTVVAIGASVYLVSGYFSANPGSKEATKKATSTHAPSNTTDTVSQSTSTSSATPSSNLGPHNQTVSQATMQKYKASNQSKP